VSFLGGSRNLYWLAFESVSVMWLALLFTATYVGALLVRSLHFVSSLSLATLSRQYMTAIVLTLVMQSQWLILLLCANEEPMREVKTPTHFFMLLVYLELMAASLLNHLSFRNEDLRGFGRASIRQNEVQLFDFQPDFSAIHDLHNYRRVYGDRFLFEADHQRAAFESREQPTDVHSAAAVHGGEMRSGKARKPQRTPLTTLITDDAKVVVLHETPNGRPPSTRHKNRRNDAFAMNAKERDAGVVLVVGQGRKEDVVLQESVVREPIRHIVQTTNDSLSLGSEQSFVEPLTQESDESESESDTESEEESASEDDSQRLQSQNPSVRITDEAGEEVEHASKHSLLRLDTADSEPP